MSEQLALDWEGNHCTSGSLVYFLEAPALGLVKIGFTTNLLERMKTLAIGPVECRLLKTIGNVT